MGIGELPPELRHLGIERHRQASQAGVQVPGGRVRARIAEQPEILPERVVRLPEIVVHAFPHLAAGASRAILQMCTMRPLLDRSFKVSQQREKLFNRRSIKLRVGWSECLMRLRYNGIKLFLRNSEVSTDHRLQSRNLHVCNDGDPQHAL